jgi:ankyrin repeat protein
VSPEYVATDFPYGQDEFISYAGTSWATLALLSALPKTAQATEMAHTVVADGPGWARTALFGTPQQLASLLDAGLDPNSRTSNGTTVLMMAAPDRSKIEVLLGRGADAKVRAASGCDALSAAGAYRDTAGSMRLLLEHGAEPNPPSGVRARCSALVFASMTGDLDAVTLLLAHGADPSKAAAGNTPLTAALTFGYPEVARTLISAGASASITEKTGINLLHWAVITNRAAVIPVLVQAGVPLNAIDENGYTPLMYAATIDFGDTAAAKALLEAGADRSVRNPEGRNPSEQAEFYHHAQLADTLR